jgi:hypothetical protein
MMERLKKLNLKFCNSITRSGLLKLINSPKNNKLTCLKILNIGVDRAIDTALTKTSYFENLRTLQLSSVIELQSFFSSPKAKNLENVMASHPELDYTKIKKLKKYHHFKSDLTKVYLYGSKNIESIR